MLTRDCLKAHWPWWVPLDDHWQGPKGCDSNTRSGVQLRLQISQSSISRPFFRLSSTSQVFQVWIPICSVLVFESNCIIEPQDGTDNYNTDPHASFCVAAFVSSDSGFGHLKRCKAINAVEL